MKRNRKMLALAAATMLTVSSSPMAFGVDGTVYSTQKATDSVNTTKLDKYLVMKQDANVPSATFDFTIEPIASTAAIAADAEHGKLAVLPGVGTPKLYLGIEPDEDDDETVSLSFSYEEDKESVIAEGNKTNGDTPVFVTADTTDEKYVKKTVNISFAGVTFTEPGVYRYTITESGINLGIENGYLGQTVENNTVTLIREYERTLDVYVEDANAKDNGKPMLKIAGYAMYDGKVTTAPSAIKINDNPATEENEFVDSKADGATKDASITNIYGTQNLTFAKVVTGNQGSKDKYFKFTVSITGIKALGTTFTADVVNGAEASVPNPVNAATNSEYAGKVNLTSFAVEQNKIVDATDAEKKEEALNTYGYYVTSTGEGANTVYTVIVPYYLQNGQYITIKGLPLGATYAVEEDAEDYTSIQNITKEFSFLNYDGQEGNDAFGGPVSGTIGNKNIYTGYTNDRSGAIPTGIIASIAGPIILVGVGVVGVIVAFICIKKKKSEEEN